MLCVCFLNKYQVKKFQVILILLFLFSSSFAVDNENFNSNLRLKNFDSEQINDSIDDLNKTGAQTEKYAKNELKSAKTGMFLSVAGIFSLLLGIRVLSIPLLIIAPFFEILALIISAQAYFQMLNNPSKYKNKHEAQGGFFISLFIIGIAYTFIMNYIIMNLIYELFI